MNFRDYLSKAELSKVWVKSGAASLLVGGAIVAVQALAASLSSALPATVGAFVAFAAAQGVAQLQHLRDGLPAPK